MSHEGLLTRKLHSPNSSSQKHLIQNEYFWLCFQAVQIQLLRLIQYFCNGNTESLHHFLSRTEYSEYCDIAAATAPCTMENCTKGEFAFASTK